MTRRARARLAKVLDFLDGELGVADKMQQRIDQHRSMTGRQDKTVPVGPVGLCRIEFQVLFEQDGGDIRHSDGHAGVAGIRSSDSVECKRADGGRL